MSRDTDHTPLGSLPKEPFELFASWRQRAAAAAEIQYPEAMCLSTVDRAGRPQGRFVIAHPQPDGTFVFLTDARSPKARSLAARPLAALTAYWGRPLELQVRIEGEVDGAPEELADEIFARRPRRSRMTPWVSRQSEPVELGELLDGLERLTEELGVAGLPRRPDTWVGYRLVPASYEFWAARAGRLHDRFLYTRDGAGGWSLARLAP